MHLPRPIRRTSVLVAGILFGILASSCSMKDKGAESRVVLNIPSSKTLSSRVGALSYAWEKACFAINITAPDITSPADSSCEVHRGVFAGMVAPNSTLSAYVSRGGGRKLELFAYLRSASTDACPQLAGGFGGLDRKKIVRVGLVESFDVDSDEVNLTVNVSEPAATDSVYSQYSMPAVCVANATTPNSAGGRLVAGASQSSSAGSFTIRQRLSFKPEEAPLTSAGGYKIRGSLSMEGL